MAKIETDSKGIPLKSSTFPEGVPVPALIAGMTVVLGTLGAVAAWFLAYAPEAKRARADAKIDVLSENDLGWLYLGILALKIGQLPLGILLAMARKESKVNVPDQHVYCVKGAEGSKLGYVLMEDDGVHGKFNRAQRAFQNYVETFTTVLVLYVAASWVFPFEAFVCAVVWAATRVIYAVGYQSSVDERNSGLMLGFLAINALQGMVGIAAVKSL